MWPSPQVAYYGRKGRAYRCDNPNLMLAAARCLTFGSSRIDSVLARELLRAVEPIAVEAAMAAERLRMERVNERRHILELDLQQARYEASLAERRYAACDPDNRLIAAQLEKSWETALRQVEACQARLEPATHDMAQSANSAFSSGWPKIWKRLGPPRTFRCARASNSCAPSSTSSPMSTKPPVTCS